MRKLITYFTLGQEPLKVFSARLKTIGDPPHQILERKLRLTTTKISSSQEAVLVVAQLLLPPEHVWRNKNDNFSKLQLS